MDAGSHRGSGSRGEQPFDRHARRYDTVWGDDPVAQRQRAAVWALAEEVLPAGGRVLDAGCGVGIDLAWLLGQGFDAVGIDASAGMIAASRARLPEATLAVAAVDDPAAMANLGAFDGAIMDFGVVNCLRLDRAARSLARALRPGAPLIVVPMPRLNPSWTLSALWHGRPGRALSRLAREVDVPVEGGTVRTRYLGASEIRQAFAPWFRLERRGSLGLLLPPPGTRWPEARLDRLASVEAHLRHLPVLRELGDHLLLQLRRESAPVAPEAW